jgi:hypothetical protein
VPGCADIFVALGVARISSAAHARLDFVVMESSRIGCVVRKLDARRFQPDFLAGLLPGHSSTGFARRRDDAEVRRPRLKKVEKNR